MLSMQTLIEIFKMNGVDLGDKSKLGKKENENFFNATIEILELPEALQALFNKAKKKTLKSANEAKADFKFSIEFKHPKDQNSDDWGFFKDRFPKFNIISDKKNPKKIKIKGSWSDLVNLANAFFGNKKKILEQETTQAELNESMTVVHSEIQLPETTLSKELTDGTITQPVVLQAQPSAQPSPLHDPIVAELVNDRNQTQTAVVLQAQLSAQPSPLHDPIVAELVSDRNQTPTAVVLQAQPSAQPSPLHDPIVAELVNDRNQTQLVTETPVLVQENFTRVDVVPPTSFNQTRIVEMLSLAPVKSDWNSENLDSKKQKILILIETALGQLNSASFSEGKIVPVNLEKFLLDLKSYLQYNREVENGIFYALKELLIWAEQLGMTFQNIEKARSCAKNVNSRLNDSIAQLDFLIAQQKTTRGGINSARNPFASSVQIISTLNQQQTARVMMTPEKLCEELVSSLLQYHEALNQRQDQPSQSLLPPPYEAQVLQTLSQVLPPNHQETLQLPQPQLLSPQQQYPVGSTFSGKQVPSEMKAFFKDKISPSCDWILPDRLPDDIYNIFLSIKTNWDAQDKLASYIDFTSLTENKWGTFNKKEGCTTLRNFISTNSTLIGCLNDFKCRKNDTIGSQLPLQLPQEGQGFFTSAPPASTSSQSQHNSSKRNSFQ